MAFKNRVLKKFIRKNFRDFLAFKSRFVKEKFFLPFNYRCCSQRLKSRRLKFNFREKLKNWRRLRFFYKILTRATLKACFNFKRGSLRPNLLLALNLLERRLFSVLLRSQLFWSNSFIKQIIAHNKVFVNGQKLNTMNSFLSPGDVISFDISLRPLLKKSLIELKQPIHPYPHLEVNYKVFTIVVKKDLLLPSELPWLFNKKINLTRL